MQTLIIIAALAWGDTPEVAAYTLSVDSKPTPAAAVLEKIAATPVAELPPAPEAVSPVVAIRKPRAAKVTHDTAQSEADGHWCTPENCVAGCACHAQATPQAAPPAPAKAAPQATTMPTQYRIQAPAQAANSQGTTPFDGTPRLTPGSGVYPYGPMPARAPAQAVAQPVYQQPTYYYTYPQAGACANGQCGTSYAQPMRRGLFGRWR